MLGKVFARFVENSPLSIMVRGTLERVLGADQLAAWFARTAQQQDTRTVCFSTVDDWLRQVVFRIQPSGRAADREREDDGGPSLLAVDHQRKGLATQTSAELVCSRASVWMPVIAQLDDPRASWLPGYRVKIMAGTCIAASQRRLKAWREGHGGAVPGTSWGVSAPADGVGSEVCPCEDGQAQERTLFGLVLATGHANARGIPERHFCPGAWLCALESRGAGWITRQPAGLPCEPVNGLRSVGRIETGHGAEPRVQVRDAQGGRQLCRRIRVKRDPATRAGHRVRSILTNVPLRKASATRGARLDRTRWPLETACQHLAADGHAAIHTWGSPQGALCGGCLAWVADDMVAVVTAALRSVSGAAASAQELALYYVAHDMAHTSHGRLIALPEDAWRVFSRLRVAEMAAILQELAQQVRRKAYRKTPRGPKKPQPKRAGHATSSHVSTAKILRNRKGNATTP